MRTIFAPQEAELAAHLDYKHKSAGTDLMTLAGGQFILPIEAVAGGMSSGIPPGAAAEMRVQLEEALPLACALFDRYREMPVAMQDRIGTWGDDASTHNIAAVEDHRPNYYGDQIRVMGSDGAVLDSFPVRDYRDYLTEEDTDHIKLLGLHQLPGQRHGGQQPGARQSGSGDGHPSGRPVPGPLPG